MKKPAWFKKKLKSGFTLVEIITVLVVIAGLIIISYLSIPGIQAKVRDARRKADLKQMAIAIDEYRESTNCYPQALPVCGNKIELEGSTIISDIPCDPGTDNSYIYISEDSQCPSWFQLYSNLENEGDNIIDEVGCTNGCGPDCQFNYGISSSNQNLHPYCQGGVTQNGEGEEDSQNPNQYVCDPAGACEVYENPEISGCPDIYPDDPTCQDQCEPRENRCRDERGKITP